MLLLRRHLLPLLRAISPLPSPIHHRACPLLSTSTSNSAAPFSLEDYLVAACGLVPAQARETAKKAFRQVSKDCKKKAFEELCRPPRLRSASNPDAILALLSGVGLTRTDIASIVAADPLLLASSVKNVGPRLHALRDCLGLSAPQIFRFLLVGSRALRRCNIVPKLEFFISFYGSFERLLVIMKSNNSVLFSDFERVIKPNIALLSQWGLSVRDIAQLCSHCTWLLTFSPERVKEFLLRAEELGVSRTSPMFKEAIKAVASINKEKVAPKFKFLKSILGISESEVAIVVSKMPSILGYSEEGLLSKFQFLMSTLGCSESEAAIAVSKKPNILGYSEEGLLRKIQFLIQEVGMEPHYIVERPVLLSYSLEKRQVPRHYVMKVLQAKGLLSSKISFYTLALIGEKTFRLKYIDCHKDSVPGLADAYAAASAGVVPSGIKFEHLKMFQSFSLDGVSATHAH